MVIQISSTFQGFNLLCFATCQQSNLNRLKFNYKILLYRKDFDALTNNIGLYNANLVRAIFNYAAFHNISEIETYMTLLFSESIQDLETLTTLKLNIRNYSSIRLYYISNL